jgi:hypothetical protein
MSVSNRTAEKRGSFRYQINISTKPRDKIREVTIYFGYSDVAKTGSVFMPLVHAALRLSLRSSLTKDSEAGI